MEQRTAVWDQGDLCRRGIWKTFNIGHDSDIALTTIPLHKQVVFLYLVSSLVKIKLKNNSVKLKRKKKRKKLT